MKNNDTLIAYFIIGLSVFLLYKTGGFSGSGDSLMMSPSFFPRLILIALTVCCVGLIIKSKMKKVSFNAPGSVLFGIGSAAVYLALMPYAGYFIVTPVFLFGFPYFLGYRKKGILAVLTISFTAFSFFIFYKFLGVPLPEGLLEGLI